MGVRMYEEMSIEIVNAPTYPIQIISDVIALWRAKNDYSHREHGGKTLLSYADVSRLISRNHLSPLEHVNITFFLDNVSKNMMAQITRHRIGSFSFNSQHYQRFDGRDLMVTNKLFGDEENRVKEHYLNSLELYRYLVEDCNVDISDARTVLPGGVSHCGYWTVNLRSLINFLNLRLCERNTDEMVIFANKLYTTCLSYWRDLFLYVGPDCLMRNGCTQDQIGCQLQKEKRRFHITRNSYIDYDEELIDNDVYTRNLYRS